MRPCSVEKSKLMKAILGVNERENAEGVRQEKSQYLAYLSVAARFIPRSFQTHHRERYTPLLSARSRPIALFIQIAGEAIMRLISPSLPTIGSTIPSYSQTVEITLMGSKISGNEPLCAIGSSTMANAKRHMRKFNGVPKAHFGLYLKECEWRFNTPDPKRQLSQLKQWVRKNMG